MNTMDPIQKYIELETRRQFFGRAAKGIGAAALGSLLGEDGIAQASGGGVLGGPHMAPRAKRVIYLFMAGAPSQIDTFDYKPKMTDWFDKDLPDSVRQGQRLTTMTSKQKRFPIAPSIYDFKQYGQSGATVSELLPYTSRMVDDLAFVKTVWTEAIDHDPAITYIQTGRELPGWPSLGSWLAYGLGVATENLPNYVVMTPTWSGRKSAQALYNRLWGTGFLPSRLQGVALRAKGDPVLFLSNPPGVDRETRGKMLAGLARLNALQYEQAGDPETQARTTQYEMAFRMQTSVPELTDFSQEPQHILDMYGPDVTKPGTFAASCLLARRMAERGVQCIQLFHRVRGKTNSDVAAKQPHAELHTIIGRAQDHLAT